MKKMEDEMAKEKKAAEFNDEICVEQLDDIGKAKEPIKKAIQYNIQRKEKVRQIESKERRTVHFLFNTNMPCKISPFARKYLRLIEGNLDEFEREENERFQSYVERLEN